MNLPAPFGLYIHIPFCRSKCPYCSFYSVRPADFRQVREYVDALINQARQINSCQKGRLTGNRPVKSIYIGGGTPSVLGVSEINRLISSIFSIFRVNPAAEVTIEANPGDIFDSFFLNFPFYFNRISVGVQSFNSGTLGFLNRRHTSEKALQALETAKKAGLNVSGDLIFNVPGQSLGDFMTDLDIMISSGVDHVSLYDLHVEPGAPMYPLENQDQELNWLMYAHALKRLFRAGIRQYEVSNFSRPGCESIHNLGYWSGTDFLGLGPGACS